MPQGYRRQWDTKEDGIEKYCEYSVMCSAYDLLWKNVLVLLSSLSKGRTQDRTAAVPEREFPVLLTPPAEKKRARAS